MTMDRYLTFLIKRAGFPIQSFWIEAQDQEHAKEQARRHCGEGVRAELWLNGAPIGQVGSDQLVSLKRHPEFTDCASESKR